jgi:hypothetical protein
LRVLPMAGLATTARVYRGARANAHSRGKELIARIERAELWMP